jgi:hypothetical protein
LFNNNPLSGIAERPIVLKMKGEKPNNQNRWRENREEEESQRVIGKRDARDLR